MWEYVNSMRVRSLAVEVAHEVASFFIFTSRSRSPSLARSLYGTRTYLPLPWGGYCIVSVTYIAT